MALPTYLMYNIKPISLRTSILFHCFIFSKILSQVSSLDKFKFFIKTNDIRGKNNKTKIEIKSIYFAMK